MSGKLLFARILVDKYLYDIKENALGEKAPEAHTHTHNDTSSVPSCSTGTLVPIHS